MNGSWSGALCRVCVPDTPVVPVMPQIQRHNRQVCSPGSSDRCALSAEVIPAQSSLSFPTGQNSAYEKGFVCFLMHFQLKWVNIILPKWKDFVSSLPNSLPHVVLVEGASNMELLDLFCKVEHLCDLFIAHRQNITILWITVFVEKEFFLCFIICCSVRSMYSNGTA